MKFVEDLRGCLWPVDRISKIGRLEREEFHGRQLDVRYIYFGDDQPEGPFSENSVTQMRQLSCPIVPADSGHSIIRVDLTSNNSVRLTPVIAWCMSDNEGSVPVTYDGLNDGADESLSILFADGSVMVPADQTFQTLDDYLDHLRESNGA